jgi:hypothetical protein
LKCHEPAKKLLAMAPGGRHSGRRNMDSQINSENEDLYGVNYTEDTGGCPIGLLPVLIRKRAYQLFVARGRVPGWELDDWLQAERELKHHLNF